MRTFTSPSFVEAAFADHVTPTEARLRHMLDCWAGTSGSPTSLRTYREKLAELVWSTYTTCVEPELQADHLRFAQAHRDGSTVAEFSMMLWLNASAFCTLIDNSAYSGTLTGALRAITHAVQRSEIEGLSDLDVVLHANVERRLKEEYEQQHQVREEEEGSCASRYKACRERQHEVKEEEAACDSSD